MLEAEAIERLGVVHRCDHGCSPGVFQIRAHLIPHVNQEMTDTTALNAALLVAFASDLRAEPVQHKALINLRCQHGAGYVAEVSH